MHNENNKTIDINKIKNPTEREIILFIEQKQYCRYGDLLKSLHLSYRKGQELVYSLVSRGYLEFIGRSSDLQLTAPLKHH